MDPANPRPTQQPCVYDTNPFLPDRVTPNPTFGNVIYYNLALAPAERADLVVDLTGATPGDRYILYSDAPAPWPAGDPRNDYFTNDLNNSAYGGAGTTAAGKVPNTRTLMEFRVVRLLKGRPDDTARMTPQARANFIAAKPKPIPTLDPAQAVKVRQITLNETFEDPATKSFTINNGRLVQYIGGATTGAGTFGCHGEPGKPQPMGRPDPVYGVRSHTRRGGESRGPRRSGKCTT